MPGQGRDLRPAAHPGRPIAGPHPGHQAAGSHPVAGHDPVAAAVLPHPPLLVAELAGAAAAELDPLRAACHQALSTVLGAADVTVVVGDGPVWGVAEAGAGGSFQPYGADVEVTLPALGGLDLPDLPPPARLGRLPLSLAVAAHLLAALDPPPARLAAVTVPGSLGPAAAAALGRALTAAARELGAAGLVAMADLSACRTEQAPGAFRAEAAGFDASVAEAFRSGDPARLLDLDPAHAAGLLVAGRAPLQALAGAFAAGSGSSDGSRPEGASPLRGQVLYDDAPYGVGYLVAVLTAS
jgi:hypothetical protein